MYNNLIEQVEAVSIYSKDKAKSLGEV